MMPTLGWAVWDKIRKASRFVRAFLLALLLSMSPW
jgi:hypothetical protein